MTINKADVNHAIKVIIDGLPENEKLLYEEMCFGPNQHFEGFVDNKAKYIDINGGSKGARLAKEGAAKWQPLFDYFKSKKKGNHSKTRNRIDNLLFSVGVAAAWHLQLEGCSFVMKTDKSMNGIQNYRHVTGTICAFKMMRILDPHTKPAAKTGSPPAAEPANPLQPVLATVEKIHANQETHP